MKTLLSLLALALILPVGAGEEKFKTAADNEIGKSNAFELTTDNRVVLKTGTGGYVIIELLGAGREDGEKSFSEECSIYWALVNTTSVESDVKHTFIRYTSKKTGEDSYEVEQIGGSDELEFGGLSLRWSFATSTSVFIYPKPGTEYAITKKQNKPEMATPRKPSD